jgi:hypothetical protein
MSLDSRIKMYRDKKFCHLTIEDFLKNSCGLNQSEVRILYNDLMKVDIYFYYQMPLPIITCLLVIDLYIPSDWYQLLNINDLYGHLLNNFEECNLGNFISDYQNIHNGILTNVHAEYQDNDNHISIFLRSSKEIQMSDSVKINFGELYFTSTERNNILPISMQFQSRSRCTLYFTYEISVSEIHSRFDDLFGKLVLINDNIIECVITNYQFFNELWNKKPNYVKNGIMYSLNSWEYLQKSILQKFFLLKPKNFMIFIYPDQLYNTTLDDSENKTLWEEYLLQFGLGGNIHRLNSNFSTFFYCIEGSLELVDIFLKIKKNKSIEEDES